MTPTTATISAPDLATPGLVSVSLSPAAAAWAREAAASPPRLMPPDPSGPMAGSGVWRTPQEVALRGTRGPEAEGERRPRRSRLSILASLLVGAVFSAAAAAYGFFQVRQARAGVPTVFPDTEDYIDVARHPVLSRDFLAAHRPPLTPLLWKLAGTPEAFVVAQTVLGVLAWITLAWVVRRLVGGQLRGLVAAGCVLAFACSDPISMWHRIVLTETLALGALALLVAAGMAWAQRPRVLRGLLVTVAAGLFLAARDSGVVVIVGLVGALGLYCLVRHASVPKRAWVGIIGLALVAGLSLASASLGHRFDTNFRNVISSRVLPHPERVEWWANQGMPQARAIEAAGRANPSDCGNPLVASARIFEEERFAPLVEWLGSQGRRVYLKWMAAHPSYVFTEPFERPERATCNNGRLHDYAPKDRYVVPYVTDILYPRAEIMFALSALAVVAAKRVRGRGRGVPRPGAMGFLCLMGALGMVHMLVAWHSDGMESRRHGLEGNAQARLAMVLALVILVLAARQARRERPPEVEGVEYEVAEAGAELTVT